MKIVSAANAMIATRDRITNAVPGTSGNEIFFLYDQKHKWSISKIANDEYNLFYYPGSQTINELASWPDDAWYEFAPMIRYNTKEIGTKEAKETFSELYRIVNENLFGINEVLDDIISKANWS
jgi:hypothetical protein